MQLISDYAPTTSRGGVSLDTSKLDATAGYLRHYQNLLTLTFFHTKGTREERQQAAIEMVVCERKLAWWRNLPQFDQVAATRGVEMLKKQWDDVAA